MSNLSKIRRDKMIEFLETLKEQHSDDESLIAINQIEKELLSKRYGLVWEEHEEVVDVMMRDNIPVFTEVKEREICMAPGENYNFLLEGDNLHSLHLLEKTHRGKVDVIYIDPPYNTGNKDFVYDDAFVVKEDTYCHSKWLSFMSLRLNLARNLLTDDGLIFVSISDVEQANLRLLCNEIFGDNNFVANLVWANKEGGGSSDSKLFRIKHEYILVYAKDITMIEIAGVNISNEERYKCSDEYERIRGKYYLQKLGMGSIQYSESLDYPIETPDHTYINPKDNNSGKKACWRWSKDKYMWGLKNGFIEIKKDAKGIWTVYTKQYLNCDNEGNIIKRTNRPMGIIDEFSSTQGAKTIKQLFENVAFSYPKDVKLIKWLLQRMVKKNVTVLDFFAGSGTTAQAVLELNKEDGGHRKFILCTNNENNICEDITYQRIKTVINGKRQDGSIYSEGILANLKYYHTDFVSKSEEYLADALLDHVTEMIQLEHGIKIDDNSYIMIMSDDEADELEKKWSEYNEIKAIYVFQDVLLTASQEALFGAADMYTIPDYYFDFELREAGELW